MKMRHVPGVVLFAVVLVVLPATASASAGTALMWAGMFHLVFGNAALGLGEGIVIAKTFGMRKRKSIVLLIAANYVSTFVAGLLLLVMAMSPISIDLHNAWPLFWVMILVMYMLTLLIKWPFVFRRMRRRSDQFRKSIQAVLLVHTITYAALIGWYWIASETSLYTQMDVVSISDIAMPENVYVYYISDADGDVYLRPFDGSESRRIHDLDSSGRNDRLFVRPSWSGSGKWDLVASIAGTGYRTSDEAVIEDAFVDDAVPSWETQNGLPVHARKGFDNVPRLGDAHESPWRFWTGFWAAAGLYGMRSHLEDPVHVAFETPFGAWYVRNAVHLPSDKVLFQLGDRQICILDVESRKVALLAYGRGPIATIKNTTIDQPEP